MIYKLIEEDDTSNSIDLQEKEIVQNPQINPLNNPSFPFYISNNNNNDNFLFQNIFNPKERNTFPNNTINTGMQKYMNNLDLSKFQTFEILRQKYKDIEKKLQIFDNLIKYEFIAKKFKTKRKK